MKRKFKSMFIIILLVLVLIFMLSFPDETINTVLFGVNIWMYNVFPSLFPFFILSDLLINYGFVELLSEFFKNWVGKLGLSSNASFPIFSSLISGSPNGARCTKQLLDEKLINIEEANYLIRFTHSCNPLFVIGTIGSVLLNSQKLGLLIFLSLILGNLIIAVIFKRKSVFYKENISLKKAIIYMHTKRIDNKNNFISILSNSIYNAIDVLILLLGIIIVFLILSNLIDKINLNSDVTIIIKGLLEMTQGIKLVSNYDFQLVHKVVFITFFLAFGGFSIHLQVSSIINSTKIKYKNFFISRILHSIISSFLVFLLFELLYF